MSYQCPNIEELVAGNYVEVAASFFTEIFARRFFPNTFKTATLWGKVKSIRGQNVAIFFATDNKVYTAKLSQILSFSIIEPSKYLNPCYEVSMDVPVMTQTSKRVPVRNPKYFSNSEDESSSDSEIQFCAKRPTKSVTLSNSSDIVTSGSVSSNTRSASSPAVSNNVNNLTESSRQQSQKKKFELFSEPFRFETVSNDRFCDSYNTPYPRFQPEILIESSNYRNPLSLFKAMLPVNFIEIVVFKQTNINLAKHGHSPMTLQEFWKYLALRIAMSLYSGTPVHDFWSTTQSFLKPMHNFGQYGISKHRFDCLTSSLTLWSSTNADDQIYQIRELVNAFNHNMSCVFKPSWVLCIDESMSMWSNRQTLPNWVYVQRKPTPTGSEWHDIACALSKVIFVIEPVESVDFVKRFEDKFSVMAATVLRLCEQSGIFNIPRVLVGDSAFPSLHLIEKLKQNLIFSIFALKKKRGWTHGIPGDALLTKTQELNIGMQFALFFSQHITSILPRELFIQVLVFFFGSFSSQKVIILLNIFAPNSLSYRLFI
jgi:hypothetical protein